MKNNYYDFTLILAGVSDLTEDMVNALFEAGCDDATPGTRDGVAFLDFTREAASLQDAVLSAIKAVEKAGIGALVLRVEPDDLVTMSEIARRVSRTRENVRQLVQGRRGPGGFPPPISNLTSHSPIWRWTDVIGWLKEKRGDTVVSRLAAPLGAGLMAAGDIAAINAALDLCRHVPTQAKAMRLCQKLRVMRPRAPKAKNEPQPQDV